MVSNLCGSRSKKDDLAVVSTAVALMFEEMNFRYVCELIRHRDIGEKSLLTTTVDAIT
jgi:hypothetical protein